MKILAINATYRPKGSTTQLAEAALEGAASVGAETEMLMLRDHRIEYCANCLKCYRDLESEIAPCPIDDDMTDILTKMRDADGIIFASPVHNGFVTGLMTAFLERVSWRVMRPIGLFLGAAGMASRLTGKTRAIASISSAGGMPARLRKHCDDGTPWLKGNTPLQLHGCWIGDIYAGAVLEKAPETAAEWAGIYFLRKLSGEQLAEARALGVKMARAIEAGHLVPTTLESYAGPLLRGVMDLVNRFSPPYKTLA